MEFDDIIRITGQLGPYVILILSINAINNLHSAVETILPNFLSPRQDHWCVTTHLQNLTLEQQKYVSLPYDEHTDSYSSCEAYNIDWTPFNDAELVKWNWTGLDTTLLPCPEGWSFDHSVFTSTATSEWELVCYKAWIHEIMSPLFLTGCFFGSLFSGPIADTFGRSRTLVGAVLAILLSGTVTVTALDVWVYIAARFFLGISTRIAAVTGVVSSIEIVAPSYRSVCVCYNRLFYSSGVLVATGLAYFIRDFHVLQAAAFIPMVLMFSMYWLLPESPRWLMSKGKAEEARKSLSTLAKRTRRDVPQDMIDGYIKQSQINQDSNSKHSVREVLTHPLLRKWVFIIGFGKLASSFIYFGVSLNLDSLSGNLFVNTMLASLTEIPAIMATAWSQYRFGPRYNGMAMFLLAGLGGLLAMVLLIVYESSMVTNVLLILTRCAASCAITACTALSSDLFPSYMRQTAVGLTGAISSAFSIFSPIVGGPLALVWLPLPSLIFGSLSLVAGCLMFLLPDTRGKSMPESLQDAVNLNKKDNLSNNEKHDNSTKKSPSLSGLSVRTPAKPGVYDTAGDVIYTGSQSEGLDDNGCSNWAFEDEFDIRL